MEKMESIQKIKDIVEQMSIDSAKVFKNGNRSAAIRARHAAQTLSKLIPIFKKELLEEAKRQKKEPNPNDKRTLNKTGLQNLKRHRNGQ